MIGRDRILYLVAVGLLVDRGLELDVRRQCQRFGA